MRWLAMMMLCGVLLGSCCDCPAPQGDEGQACFPNDSCLVGLSCVEGRCVAPSANCGNDVCDADESSASCPEDCGGVDCGNGSIDADTTEVCDGSDLGEATCTTLGYMGGTLACEANCLALDDSGCHSCGDLIIEIPEVCDASNLGGLTCRDVGFLAGTLACTSDCLGHDTSGCFNTCEAADCAECLASPCAAAACEAELAVCTTGSPCSDLIICLQACTDFNCREACNTQHSAGLTDYMALQSCLVCDPDICFDECDGQSTCP